MKIQRFLCGAAFLLLLRFALPARAQFEPPNPDELKMTADPAAPGADAVILEYRDVDRDREGTETFYERIKVLTEKGKAAATVELPYWKGEYSVAEIRGRTIHPDGSIAELAGKPEDLLSEKTREFSVNRKVFTLPAVEVGSVLEFSYQLRFNNNVVWYSGDEWRVQHKYFVHKADYEYYPFSDAGVAWWPHLPPGVTVKSEASGEFTLDITDVPPAPDEDWMPPINSVLYRVLFYYSGQRLSASDFWMTITKLWSKDVDRYAEPTKGLRDAVNGIIAPGDSDMVKAEKLYAAVQALDNTDYSRAKTESERRALHLKDVKHAEDTWKQKSSTSAEIAYLYLAMLRAAGLTAYAMQVVDRKYDVFDPSYLDFDQLNVALVVLSTGGKEIILDPGEKLCPFGQLSWRHSEARGVRQAVDGVSLMTTPAQDFADNMTTYNANLTLDGKGGVTGGLTIVMNGQEALYWRQVALENDASELKREYEKSLQAMVPDGVEVNVDQFMGLDHPDSSLVAMVKAGGTLGTAMSKRLLLPGYFFETRSDEPFVNEQKRLEPVDMEYAERVNENVTYHFPAGYTVEGAPGDVHISWPDHAILVTKSTPDKGEIRIAYSFVRAFALASADEYQDLRSFYQKMAAADQEQLVLSSAETGKGN
jgi:hypothetical protein